MGIKLHLLLGKQSPLFTVQCSQLQICPQLYFPCPLPTYPQPWVREDYISQTALPLDPKLLGQ